VAYLHGLYQTSQSVSVNYIMSLKHCKNMRVALVISVAMCMG